MSTSRLLASIRSYATQAATTTAIAQKKPPSPQTLAQVEQIFQSNIKKPASYVLSSLRSFPSLEPHGIIPIHTKFFNAPLRRDILWLSVIMELDNRRVGASNPPGRSQHKFSRRKLFQQKGTGRARVGDANSPIRFRGAYALARNAPNDHTSELNTKVYDYGYRVALSQLYREGKLFIIGNRSIDESSTVLKEGDALKLDFKTDNLNGIHQFVKHHGFEKQNLLFISDDFQKVTTNKLINLTFMKIYNSYKKIKIVKKEQVEVRDLLKANRVFIDENTLEFFANKFGKHLNLTKN